MFLTRSLGLTKRNKKVIKTEKFRSGSAQIFQLFSALQLPELPSSSGLITVEVKGPTQQFIKRKTVHIMKVDSLVFVQTDKPIYKPGQTGIRKQISKGNFKGWMCGSLLFYSPIMKIQACCYLCYLPPIPIGGFHGQNLSVSVRFRVVSVDVNFHPLNETVSLITVDEFGGKRQKRRDHSFGEPETNTIS